MNPFLKSLATSLFTKYGRDIKDLCLVFPNRRAGLFFRKYLAEVAGITLISPQIYTINEFISELSGLEPADPVDLIFEIYEVYSGIIENAESFDDFYQWGETMIRDFDDLDKSMVNPEALFSNILDLKKIDTVFDYLTDEQKETIRKFWGSFSVNNISEHQDTFLTVWRLLYPVYSGLNKRLRENSLAYEGMIYREVAGRILIKKYPDLPWNKIILAGFNALSEAEKILFRFFRDSGIGEFYWDYDKYYVDNSSKEAGRFIRNNLLEFPSAEIDEQFSNLGSQEICIYELPSDVTQAKFIHKLFESRDLKEMKVFHDTALILCNENLLIPVIHSLPPGLRDINITMGYPLSLTPVYSFINQILVMQGKLAKQSGKRENKFYYKHVLAILDHQYTNALQEHECDSLKIKIRSRNIIYADSSLFHGQGILEQIFIKTNGIGQLIDYLISLLCEIVKISSIPDAEVKDTLEREYIYYLLIRLRKLKEIFEKHSVPLSIETFSVLFRKIIRSSRIPFEGEPLGGLQVMGILETRLLDFNNLIFLSMNEGIIPGAQSFFSYIPGNLRYAFNMPTKEDHDAIYAYYFYRVLQRSGKVHLLYNNKTEGVFTGEMSRYLYQLLYDKRFNVSFKSIGFNIAERVPKMVTIPKSPGVTAKLDKLFVKGSIYLSPSSLNTYLDCRLKFYFSRIAGLKEPDEVAEEIEARELGTLLHETMFRLYQPWIGVTITESDISDLLRPENLKSAIDRAFRKEYYKTSDDSMDVIPEGKNIIVYEVIKKYAEKILQSDQKYSPFEIIALEKNFMRNIEISTSKGNAEISIGGKIDRIDRKNDKVRIIDYKTGKGETGIKSVDELFDGMNINRNRAVLQTLIYAWIISNTFREPLKITTGLYLTKKIFGDDFDPTVKLGNNEIDFFKIKDPFLIKLQETIAEIYDHNVPFDQTTLIEHCMNCDFAEICHRKSQKTYN